MLDAHVTYGDLHYIHSLRDASDPVIRSKRCDSLRHSLIQRACRYFHCVRNAIQILNRHAARSQGHKGKVSIFAFYSPYLLV